MALDLPSSFDFTVLPEHVKAEHRCDSSKCVMALACLAFTPEGYVGEPVVGTTELGFRTTWVDEYDNVATDDVTDELSLDATARRIVDLFDNGKCDEALLKMIGTGLTFVVDTDAMIVRVKE